jgi:uncharacterized membrane protein
LSDAGTAALVLLVRDVELEKVLPRMEEPGHVVRDVTERGRRAQLEAARQAG